MGISAPCLQYVNLTTRLAGSVDWGGLVGCVKSFKTRLGVTEAVP